MPCSPCCVGTFAPRAAAVGSRPHRRARPRLEPLEYRLAPATLTVLNANDSGPDSLRDDIPQGPAFVLPSPRPPVTFPTWRRRTSLA
jgi:hypothetical protein